MQAGSVRGSMIDMPDELILTAFRQTEKFPAAGSGGIKYGSCSSGDVIGLAGLVAEHG